jgi:perosamine synthetase
MIKVAFATTGEEELGVMRSVLERGYYGLAEKVLEFEKNIEAFIGVRHIVAVNTGTSALHLALDILGIGPGDEVIVPSLTYVASFQAISMTGANPVACDVYPDTLLMDIEDAKHKITKQTKAFMPVHYAGNPCDMDALLEIKEKYDIRIVEDAAHAFGSYYKGRKIGSFGDITCFSFDSIKVITCGEGGVIVCRDEELADLLRQKRLLGMDRKSHTSQWKEREWSFDVKTQGYRYHMSNINAAIGIEQLKKLNKFIQRRREISKRYRDTFRSIPQLRLLNADYDSIAPFMFVVRVRDNMRNKLMEFLKEKDIETGINYIPNHTHAFYNSNNTVLTETERAYQEILTLPLHCSLRDEDVDYIIDTVKKFFDNS